MLMLMMKMSYITPMYDTLVHDTVHHRYSAAIERAPAFSRVRVFALATDTNNNNMS